MATKEPAFDLEALTLTIGGKKPGFFSSSKAFRACVPGGWLIFIWDTQGMGGVTFYPDPKHDWDGGTLPEK